MNNILINFAVITSTNQQTKKHDSRVGKYILKMSYFVENYSSNEIEIYSTNVDGKEVTRKLNFSTDIVLCAKKMFNTILSRFQIKFFTEMLNNIVA